uniref:Collagenase-like protease n=1 Tax=Desulfovibrio sp. U5L TaxID=596152 RepID=I2Q3L0_9BACT
MRFEVPFVPDTAYAALLAAHRDAIAAVYFRLGPDTPDGRLPGIGDASPQELAEGLANLPGVARLGLLNAAFHGPEVLAGDGLRDLVLLLEGYLAAGAITGIVYADHYLLTALSDTAPDVARELTAIPSINFRLDRFERLAAILDAVADTRFRFPDAVILDRDLNRDTKRVAALAEAARRTWPGLKVGLMANEGCLFACPFKTPHDAYIALSRLASCPAGPDMNRDIGCLRSFFKHPGRMLASPFLRPEDVGQVEGLVDFLKICGRTRPAAELAAIVRAYLDGSFAGNLAWLLDTQEILSGRLWIGNSELPEDFFERTDGCSHRCGECGYCDELAGRLVRELEPGLPRFTAG